MVVSKTHWQPSASLDTLRQRATVLAHIRSFFNTRGYLEVETPIMGQFGVTDVYLANIKAYFRGQPYCLQTSPEYHMKRLLAAGSGPIFQLARVFREDELGRWHNPEFTLLEWYKLDVDHHGLMEEVNGLLQSVLGCPPLVTQTYQAAFQEHCAFDPMHASLEELRDSVLRFDLDAVLPHTETDRDQYLFLLMSCVVEPALAKSPAPVAIYDFPVSQAALARVKNGVAERFEVYYQGIELANGFHELTDASAQKARFEQDARVRFEKGMPVNSAPDAFLLDALEYGLPLCSGVALGIDRLLMLALQQKTLAKTLAFDFTRA